MGSSASHALSAISSFCASTLTAWRGSLVEYPTPAPEQALVLYDFEACPFCRRVREVFTALALDVEVRPCPAGGTRFRPEAEALGGKQQFPLLVDRNHDAIVYESNDIVAHLFRVYANRGVPFRYITPLAPVFGSLASAVRLGKGGQVRASRAPARPLHLWSFESSPFSRFVREVLSELELPYTLHSLGKEHWNEAGPPGARLGPKPYVPRPGGKREVFWREHDGRVQVPYLVDPNTDTAMFESRDIVRYLNQTYAA